jgi:hypothetical protein
MRLYLSGAITSDSNYREKSARVQARLEEEGHEVISPLLLPDGLLHHEYLHVDYALIDICEGVYFMIDWKMSTGAIKERHHALREGKIVLYETAIIKDRETRSEG